MISRIELPAFLAPAAATVPEECERRLDLTFRESGFSHYQKPVGDEFPGLVIAREKRPEEDGERRGTIAEISQMLPEALAEPDEIRLPPFRPSAILRSRGFHASTFASTFVPKSSSKGSSAPARARRSRISISTRSKISAGISSGGTAVFSTKPHRRQVRDRENVSSTSSPERSRFAAWIVSRGSAKSCPRIVVDGTRALIGYTTDWACGP